MKIQSPLALVLVLGLLLDPITITINAQRAPPYVEPLWYKRLEAEDTTGLLRRCKKRTKKDAPPNTGDICARKPKVCYFGTQYNCSNNNKHGNEEAGAARPETKCVCDGRDDGSNSMTWSCTPATTASTSKCRRPKFPAPTPTPTLPSQPPVSSIGAVTWFGQEWDPRTTTRIDLQYKNPSDTIPTAIGLMTQLTYLNVGRDSLQGTIPSTLGMLTQLTWLDLIDNIYLTGTIPSTLGMLTQLTTLHMYGNGLTGTIPTELGLMTQLTRLVLEQNIHLTGTIPSTLGMLTQLEVLSLFDNSLTGTIPSTLGMLTQITWLELSGNSLTGTIPSTLGMLTQIRWLELSGNSLTGTIPSSLGMLTLLNR